MYYQLIDAKRSMKLKYFPLYFLLSQVYFDTRMTRSESDQRQFLVLLHLVIANTLVSHSLHNSFAQGRTHSWAHLSKVQFGREKKKSC